MVDHHGPPWTRSSGFGHHQVHAAKEELRRRAQEACAEVCEQSHAKHALSPEFDAVRFLLLLGWRPSLLGCRPSPLGSFQSCSMLSGTWKIHSTLSPKSSTTRVCCTGARATNERKRSALLGCRMLRILGAFLMSAHSEVARIRDSGHTWDTKI